MSRKLLLNTLATLHKEVHSHFSKRFKGTPHAEQQRVRLKKLFDYTLGDGKCGRGQLALDTFQTLLPTASQTQLTNAAKVAASIEISEVGLKACIDGLMLESAVDIIVRNALRDHPQKYSIFDNVTETKVKTVTGQELDVATTKIEDFNWRLYRDIVEHKTSHYTYYFPLLLGFQLADVSINLDALRSVAYNLGYLFQAQDDYLDAFGNILVTGKSSSDFSDSKCTWIVCALLNRIANDPVKMRQFATHFGSADPKHLTAIRELLVTEKIDAEFQSFQAKTIDELSTEIAAFPMPEIRHILDASLRNIAHRQK